MGQSTRYLLVGGGVASVAAAQAIRALDTEGSMVLATADTYMPYDRPPLSKGFLRNPEVTADDAACKFDNFYPDNNIDLRRGVTATRIHTKNKTVDFSDGTSLGYEKLLIATGAKPRQLSLAFDEQKVFSLRSIQDAEKIRTAMAFAKRAMVIGSGYLGVEVASSIASKGINTVLITMDKYPWEQFASPATGKFVQELLQRDGVQVITGHKVTGLSEDSAITASHLEMPIDMTVVAIGVDLNTKIASDAGIDVAEGGGIWVDECMRTREDGVYAAGDVAYFKDLTIDKRWHNEHHLSARWQGQVAGTNMAGGTAEYDRVPYFFSDFADTHMILRGDPDAPKITNVYGSFETGEYIEVYQDESGFVRMGLAFSKDEKKLDAISDKLEELIRAKAKADTLSLDTFLL